MLFFARVLELVLLVVRAVTAFFFGAASATLAASVTSAAASALASAEVAVATFLALLLVAVAWVVVLALALALVLAFAVPSALVSTPTSGLAFVESATLAVASVVVAFFGSGSLFLWIVCRGQV